MYYGDDVMVMNATVAVRGGALPNVAADGMEVQRGESGSA